MNATKIISAATFSTIVALASINSASAFDLDVGMQAWNNDIKLEGRYDDYSNNFDSDSKYKPVVWATIEHDVQFLPNFKFRYTSLKHDASSTISGSIKFDDIIFTDTDYVETSTDLSHFDVIPYYNVLDSDTLTLSLGVDVKIGEFKIYANDEDYKEEDSIKGAIPLPYAAATVKLPFDISLHGNVAGFSIKDYTAYDYELSARWKAIDTDVLDTSIEAGYRKFYLSANDIEDLDIRVKSDGFFAGVIISY